MLVWFYSKSNLKTKMKTYQLLVILTIFGFCAADPFVRYQPEQIHLSLGGELKMVFTNWTGSIHCKIL